jgi:glycerol kinase
VTRARCSGVLAIDQGTTNTKAMFVDEHGAIRGVASVPTQVRYPRPGWVESDPDEMWESVVGASHECLRMVPDSRVLGVAITNQRESVLAWRRSSGEAVSPLISWQCRRTSTEIDRLRQPAIESLLRSRTGLNPDPGYSATKIEWLLTHGVSAHEIPDLCIGTVDAWLVARLSSGASYSCDFTNASRTQLFDIERLRWSDDLLGLFSVPASILPAPLPSASLFGKLHGFGPVPDGTPIVATIGDSHAAAFAHRRFDVGSTKATYGTGTSVMTVVDQLPRGDNAVVASIAWAIPTVSYCIEANILATGACIQWVGEVLGIGPGEVESLARGVDGSEGVVIVPAFAGLGAPHWRPDVTAIITGLTRGASRGHLARAALEATALQVVDVVAAIEGSTGRPVELLQVDGGGSRNDLLMQLQSDFADRPVVRSDLAEMSALGAAYVGGLTLDLWDLAALAEMPRGEETYYPQISESARTRARENWVDAVQQCLAVRQGTAP